MYIRSVYIRVESFGIVQMYQSILKYIQSIVMIRYLLLQGSPASVASIQSNRIRERAAEWIDSSWRRTQSLPFITGSYSVFEKGEKDTVLLFHRIP